MLESLHLLFLGQVFGAFLPTAIKFGVRDFSPFMFTFLRFLVASILFLPAFFILKSNKKHLGLKDFPKALLLGLFFFANVGLYSIGIQYTTVLMAQTIYVATPIVVGLLDFFFLREKISKEQLIGLVIAMCGVGFLLIESQLKQQTLTFGTIHGNLIMMLGVLGYSCFLIYSRKLSKQFSPTSIAFASFYATGLWMTPFMLFDVSKGQAVLHHISFSSGISVFVAAFVGTILSYTLFQFGVAKVSAFVAAIFQYLSPLLAGIVSAIFLGEKPTIVFVIGSIIILSGVFYATTFKYVKRYLLK